MCARLGRRRKQTTTASSSLATEIVESTSSFEIHSGQDVQSTTTETGIDNDQGKRASTKIPSEAIAPTGTTTQMEAIKLYESKQEHLSKAPDASSSKQEAFSKTITESQNSSIDLNDITTVSLSNDLEDLNVSKELIPTRATNTSEEKFKQKYFTAEPDYLKYIVEGQTVHPTEVLPEEDRDDALTSSQMETTLVEINFGDTYLEEMETGTYSGTITEMEDTKLNETKEVVATTLGLPENFQSSQSVATYSFKSKSSKNIFKMDNDLVESTKDIESGVEQLTETNISDEVLTTEDLSKAPDASTSKEEAISKTTTESQNSSIDLNDVTTVSLSNDLEDLNVSKELIPTSTTNTSEEKFRQKYFTAEPDYLKYIVEGQAAHSTEVLPEEDRDDALTGSQTETTFAETYGDKYLKETGYSAGATSQMEDIKLYKSKEDFPTTLELPENVQSEQSTGPDSFKSKSSKNLLQMDNDLKEITEAIESEVDQLTETNIPDQILSTEHLSKASSSKQEAIWETTFESQNSLIDSNDINDITRVSLLKYKSNDLEDLNVSKELIPTSATNINEEQLKQKYFTAEPDHLKYIVEGQTVHPTEVLPEEGRDDALTSSQKETILGEFHFGDAYVDEIETGTYSGTITEIKDTKLNKTKKVVATTLGLPENFQSGQNIATYPFRSKSSKNIPQMDNDVGESTEAIESGVEQLTETNISDQILLTEHLSKALDASSSKQEAISKTTEPDYLKHVVEDQAVHSTEVLPEDDRDDALTVLQTETTFAETYLGDTYSKEIETRHYAGTTTQMEDIKLYKGKKNFPGTLELPENFQSIRTDSFRSKSSIDNSLEETTEAIESEVDQITETNIPDQILSTEYLSKAPDASSSKQGAISERMTESQNSLTKLKDITRVSLPEYESIDLEHQHVSNVFIHTSTTNTNEEKFKQKYFTAEPDHLKHIVEGQAVHSTEVLPEEYRDDALTGLQTETTFAETYFGDTYSNEIETGHYARTTIEMEDIKLYESKKVFPTTLELPDNVQSGQSIGTDSFKSKDFTNPLQMDNDLEEITEAIGSEVDQITEINIPDQILSTEHLSKAPDASSSKQEAISETRTESQNSLTNLKDTTRVSLPEYKSIDLEDLHVSKELNPTSAIDYAGITTQMEDIKLYESRKVFPTTLELPENVQSGQSIGTNSFKSKDFTNPLQMDNDLEETTEAIESEVDELTEINMANQIISTEYLSKASDASSSKQEAILKTTTESQNSLNNLKDITRIPLPEYKSIDLEHLHVSKELIPTSPTNMSEEKFKQKYLSDDSKHIFEGQAVHFTEVLPEEDHDDALAGPQTETTLAEKHFGNKYLKKVKTGNTKQGDTKIVTTALELPENYQSEQSISTDSLNSKSSKNRLQVDNTIKEETGLEDATEAIESEREQLTETNISDQILLVDHLSKAAVAPSAIHISSSKQGTIWKTTTESQESPIDLKDITRVSNYLENQRVSTNKGTVPEINPKFVHKTSFSENQNQSTKPIEFILSSGNGIDFFLSSSDHTKDTVGTIEPKHDSSTIIVNDLTGIETSSEDYDNTLNDVNEDKMIFDISSRIFQNVSTRYEIVTLKFLPTTSEVYREKFKLIHEYFNISTGNLTEMLHESTENSSYTPNLGKTFNLFTRMKTTTNLPIHQKTSKKYYDISTSSTNLTIQIEAPEVKENKKSSSDIFTLQGTTEALKERIDHFTGARASEKYFEENSFHEIEDKKEITQAGIFGSSGFSNPISEILIITNGSSKTSHTDIETPLIPDLPKGWGLSTVKPEQDVLRLDLNYLCKFPTRISSTPGQSKAFTQLLRGEPIDHKIQGYIPALDTNNVTSNALPPLISSNEFSYKTSVGPYTLGEEDMAQISEGYLFTLSSVMPVEITENYQKSTRSALYRKGVTRKYVKSEVVQEDVAPVSKRPAVIDNATDENNRLAHAEGVITSKIIRTGGAGMEHTYSRNASTEDNMRHMKHTRDRQVTAVYHSTRGDLKTRETTYLTTEFRNITVINSTSSLLTNLFQTHKQLYTSSGEDGQNIRENSSTTMNEILLANITENSLSTDIAIEKSNNNKELMEAANPNENSSSLNEMQINERPPHTNYETLTDNFENVQTIPNWQGEITGAVIMSEKDENTDRSDESKPTKEYGMNEHFPQLNEWVTTECEYCDDDGSSKHVLSGKLAQNPESDTEGYKETTLVPETDLSRNFTYSSLQINDKGDTTDAIQNIQAGPTESEPKGNNGKESNTDERGDTNLFSNSPPQENTEDGLLMRTAETIELTDSTQIEDIQSQNDKNGETEAGKGFMKNTASGIPNEATFSEYNSEEADVTEDIDITEQIRTQETNDLSTTDEIISESSLLDKPLEDFESTVYLQQTTEYSDEIHASKELVKTSTAHDIPDNSYLYGNNSKKTSVQPELEEDSNGLKDNEEYTEGSSNKPTGFSMETDHNFIGSTQIQDLKIGEETDEGRNAPSISAKSTGPPLDLASTHSEETTFSNEFTASDLHVNGDGIASVHNKISSPSPLNTIEELGESTVSWQGNGAALSHDKTETTTEKHNERTQMSEKSHPNNNGESGEYDPMSTYKGNGESALLLETNESKYGFGSTSPLQDESASNSLYEEFENADVDAKTHSNDNTVPVQLEEADASSVLSIISKGHVFSKATTSENKSGHNGEQATRNLDVTEPIDAEELNGLTTLNKDIHSKAVNDFESSVFTNNYPQWNLTAALDITSTAASLPSDIQGPSKSTVSLQANSDSVSQNKIEASAENDNEKIPTGETLYPEEYENVQTAERAQSNDEETSSENGLEVTHKENGKLTTLVDTSERSDKEFAHEASSSASEHTFGPTSPLGHSITSTSPYEHFEISDVSTKHTELPKTTPKVLSEMLVTSPLNIFYGTETATTSAVLKSYQSSVQYIEPSSTMEIEKYLLGFRTTACEYCRQNESENIGHGLSIRTDEIDSDATVQIEDSNMTVERDGESPSGLSGNSESHVVIKVTASEKESAADDKSEISEIATQNIDITEPIDSQESNDLTTLHKSIYSEAINDIEPKVSTSAYPQSGEDTGVNEILPEDSTIFNENEIRSWPNKATTRENESEASTTTTTASPQSVIQELNKSTLSRQTNNGGSITHDRIEITTKNYNRIDETETFFSSNKYRLAVTFDENEKSTVLVETSEIPNMEHVDKTSKKGSVNSFGPTFPLENSISLSSLHVSDSGDLIATGSTEPLERTSRIFSTIHKTSSLISFDETNIHGETVTSSSMLKNFQANAQHINLSSTMEVEKYLLGFRTTACDYCQPNESEAEGTDNISDISKAQANHEDLKEVHSQQVAEELDNTASTHSLQHEKHTKSTEVSETVLTVQGEKLNMGFLTTPCEYCDLKENSTILYPYIKQSSASMNHSDNIENNQASKSGDFLIETSTRKNLNVPVSSSGHSINPKINNINEPKSSMETSNHNLTYTKTTSQFNSEGSNDFKSVMTTEKTEALLLTDVPNHLVTHFSSIIFSKGSSTDLNQFIDNKRKNLSTPVRKTYFPTENSSPSILATKEISESYQTEAISQKSKEEDYSITTENIKSLTSTVAEEPLETSKDSLSNLPKAIYTTMNQYHRSTTNKTLLRTNSEPIESHQDGSTTMESRESKKASREVENQEVVTINMQDEKSKPVESEYKSQIMEATQESFGELKTTQIGTEIYNNMQTRIGEEEITGNYLEKVSKKADLFEYTHGHAVSSPTDIQQVSRKPVVVVVNNFNHKHQKINKTFLESIANISMPDVELHYVDLNSEESANNSLISNNKTIDLDSLYGTCTKTDFDQGNNCFCDIHMYLDNLKHRIDNQETVDSKKSYCETFVSPKNGLLMENSVTSAQRRRRGFIYMDDKKQKGRVLQYNTTEGLFDDNFMLPVTDRSLFYFPGETARIPCHNNSNTFDNKEVGAVWTFYLSGSSKGELLSEQGPELLLHGISVKNTGNYSCSRESEKNISEKQYWHEVEIITFPSYHILTNIFYKMNDSCSLQTGDFLYAHLPKVFYPILCSKEDEVCSVEIERPRCITREDDNYLNVTVTVKMSSNFVLTLHEKCDINCKLRFYENVVNMVYKNSENIEQIPVYSQPGSLHEVAFIPHITVKEDSSIGTKPPRVAVMCPTGFGLESKKQRVCVGCPSQTFSEDNEAFCRRCPAGQYQPEAGSGSCLQCTSPVDDRMCLRMLYTDTKLFKIYVGIAFGFTVLMIIVTMVWTSGRGKNSSVGNTFYEGSLRHRVAISRKDMDVEIGANVPLLQRPPRRIPPLPPPVDF